MQLYAQVTITPVFKGNNDSAILKSLVWARFDSSGKKYVTFQEFYQRARSLLTIDGKQREYISADVSFLSVGSDRVRAVYDMDENSIYYMLDKDTALRGPFRGTIARLKTSTNGHSYLSVNYHDSLALFIDDEPVALVSNKHEKIYGRERYVSEQEWCVFSQNGNSLYFIPQDTQYVLYRNKQRVATSPEPFAALAINNSGKFMYATWMPDSDMSDKGTYEREAAGRRLKLYAPDGKIYVADSARDDAKLVSTLYNDGTYTFNYRHLSYHQSSIINGRSHTADPEYQLYKGNGHYLVAYKENSEPTYTIEIDGKTIKTNYKQVFCPIMDSEGHYAFCGLRDYYLYANLDGKEIRNPISKHGVRGYPYSVSTDGHVVVAYPTQDSVFIYHDDTLLFKYASACQDVCKPYFGPETWIRWTPQSMDLYALAADNIFSIVHRGKLLHIPSDSINSSVQYCNSDGKNLFIIYGGKSKYSILYNGRIFPLAADDIEWTNMYGVRIFNCCMYDNTLVFYSIRHNKVCRYKVSL